jgi:HNH endonuclease/RuvA, C-terminal domain
MFDGSSVVSEMESPTWDAVRVGSRADWKRVDRELRAIAKKRAALDAEEARWLREAERLQIWRPLGMVSAFDYLERVLAYTPHTARERLRVAKALGDLPAIGESFEDGALSYSAVRELTRVATSDTDREWRDFAVGKTVRQIEDSVASHAPGSLPSDPADPTVRPHVVRLEMRADVYARFRQARTTLSNECGRHLDDNELIAALCDLVLDRSSSGRESTGRARNQIAMTVCAHCKQGWQHGGGAKIPVDEAAVEQAMCDAQHIGSIDGDAPERAHQPIPPALVRFIRHRDGGRCQTPGCRSTIGLEIHHIEAVADGGQHVASNLTLRCGSCHRAHHDGRLTISGTAPDQLETRWRHESQRADDPPPRRDRKTSSSLDDAIARVEARTALVGMGWKPAIARAALDAAASHVGSDATLEAWVREALRHCPLPRSQ